MRLCAQRREHIEIDRWIEIESSCVCGDRGRERDCCDGMFWFFGATSVVFPTCASLYWCTYACNWTCVCACAALKNQLVKTEESLHQAEAEIQRLDDLSREQADLEAKLTGEVSSANHQIDEVCFVFKTLALALSMPYHSGNPAADACHFFLAHSF